MNRPHPLFAPTAELRVPTIFLDDHVSRGLDVDESGKTILEVVERLGLQTKIRVSYAGLLELFSDALFYSDFDVDRGDAFMTSIKNSASTTVRSIRRQVPSIDDDRERSMRREGR